MGSASLLWAQARARAWQRLPRGADISAEIGRVGQDQVSGVGELCKQRAQPGQQLGSD